MSNESEEIPTTENNSCGKDNGEKDVAKKRDELLRLSEDGEIEQSVSALKKASGKQILKLYAEYERREAERANIFLTDLLISKFSDLLGGLEAIESSDE